jgi:uncharacterized damage-inducible protein DinB
MNIGTTLILVAAMAQASPPARTFTASTNPVSDAVRDLVERYSKNLVRSAELMPAEKYSFHPTEPQMTFGQLMVHIVQTNVAICSAIAGEPAAMTPDDLKNLRADTPKETLVGAVTRSFDACSGAVAKVTDARLADEVSMFGRATGQSRAAAMLTITADWADHYSTAASYLRQNGILPPTAQPPK